MEASGVTTRRTSGTLTDIGITTLGTLGIPLGAILHRRLPDLGTTVPCHYDTSPTCMRSYENKIRLAFYDASDGPRLMLFGPLGVDLASLQAVFKHLASEPEASIQLDEQPFIAAFAKLQMSSVRNTVVPPSNLRFGLRKVRAGNLPTFRWTRTCEGWDYLAGLIDGLVKCPIAGHQYMTRYPDEDAIVVVSKGEYGDEMLEGELGIGKLRGWAIEP